MSDAGAAPPYPGEGPHALWHASEDDSIARFEPAPLVWAVDTRHWPIYWFPRQCPRGTWWAGAGTLAEDADRLLLGAARVHAIQTDWLARMRSARVVAYRLPEETFVRQDPHGFWVSREPVEPLELVDAAARERGIELRIVADLAALWERVIASTLEFSGVRLRNLGCEP